MIIKVWKLDKIRSILTRTAPSPYVTVPAAYAKANYWRKNSSKPITPPGPYITLHCKLCSLQSGRWYPLYPIKILLEYEVTMICKWEFMAGNRPKHLLLCKLCIYFSFHLIPKHDMQQCLRSMNFAQPLTQLTFFLW